MAVPMTTFGSTLTELQAGINAAQGIDYQRANAQDAVNAQRLSDLLKLRAEENRTRSQREAYLAQILDAQQGRAQQEAQFNAELANRLALGNLDAQSRKDVATIQSQNRSLDPRYFQSLADIQAMNAENQQQSVYVKKLSDTRKAALAERERIKSSQGMFDFGQPNNPRWKELNDTIANLDRQAATLGIPVAPDGGYVVPDFTPIQVPAMLNPNMSLSAVPPARTPLPAPAPSVAPVTPDFLSTDSLPAIRPSGGTFRGAGAGSSWEPVLPQAARRRLRLLPDGRVIQVE